MNSWLSRFLPLACLFISMLLGMAAYRKKESSAPVKLMGLLAVWVFLYEAVGHYLGFHRKNNLWLYNIAFLVWVVGICYYYWLVLQRAFYRKMVLVLFVGYLLINIPLVFVYTFRSAAFNTPGVLISGVLVIGCSLLYLLEQNKSESTAPLSGSPLYYFCIGFIVYFSVIIFMNSMYNFLLENYISERLNRFIVYLPVLASFMFNLFISLGFICCLRNTKYT